jgi:signal transduction histidine kinase
VAPAHELAEDIAHIMTAATQAAELANRLLVFASDDCGQEPTEFPFNDLVRDTVDLMSRPIGEGIAIATDFGPDAMYVLADRGQLAQVLVNLLLNARDAVGESGTISVATAKDADHVELRVVDTGRGMTEDVVRRAFDPFFTTKPLSVGTGLGLSTAHTVVTRLGGSIQLESEPGQGTTVRIRLPIA